VSDPTTPPPLCVYCRRHPVEAVYRPFCSERCKLLDLAHWVDGDYRVAGEPMADEVTIEDAAPDAESAPRTAEGSGSSKRRSR
jgi:endogenous inhibitor of DNA gyrase (YacG/DUF329 family)